MLRTLLTVSFASAMALSSPAMAQEKIRIAWAGVSPANNPIWIMQEKKLMQRQGVDPEIISISASPIVAQALIAGEIDVTSTSVPTLVTSRLAGADMVMILASCGVSSIISLRRKASRTRINSGAKPVA